MEVIREGDKQVVRKYKFYCRFCDAVWTWSDNEPDFQNSVYYMESWDEWNFGRPSAYYLASVCPTKDCNRYTRSYFPIYDNADVKTFQRCLKKIDPRLIDAKRLPAKKEETK